MKHITLPLILSCAALASQAQTITLTFEGTLDGNATSLDSIRVMNLTQGGDTTITFPGNTLVLGTTGLSDLSERDTRLHAQPNPFTGSNEVVVGTATAGELLLYVHDAMGRELASQRVMAHAGQHRFRFTAATSGIHLVSTIHNGQRHTLRMVAVGEGGASGASLAYVGAIEPAVQLKSDRSTFFWEPGDELRYIGYAINGGLVLSDAIDEVPVATATRTFTMLRGAVCPDSPSVTDIDGNVYRTTQVGNQCWMAQELRTGTYANGDPIPNVTGSAQWIAQTSGAWCHTDNNPAYEADNGRLYNWYAVSDPRNVCPSGWHGASDAEWITLELALGMPLSEATMLNFTRGSLESLAPKLRSTDVWIGGPQGIDAVGMAMRPTARRNSSGTFLNQNNGGYWWSADVMGPSNGLVRLFTTSNSGVVRTLHDRHNGAGVRCIRD